MSKRLTIILVILSVAAWSGCSYEFPAVEPKPPLETGNANFDRIAVLGGSISAGFMDGTLNREGQRYAYTALITDMLERELGDKLYSTIEVSSETGYNFEAETIFSGENGKYELKYRNPEISYPARIPTDGEKLLDFTGPLTGLANYSIPNIRITEFNDTEAVSDNPYFARLEQKQDNESMLDIVIQQDPTLLIFQPGFEDLFSYVLAGASGNENPSVDTIEDNDLTPASVFEQQLNEILDRLLDETEADIFLATLPDPLKLPYVTTIPWYFRIEDIKNISYKDLQYLLEFNLAVQQYNRRATSSNVRPVIIFDSEGSRSFRGLIIKDEYLPDAEADDGSVIPKWRQLNDNDYLLYNAEKKHHESLESPPIQFGTVVQLDDKYALTEPEQQIITDRRTSYNKAIRAHVDSSSRIHLLDFSGLIDNVAEGRELFDGVSYSLVFDDAGIISADGYSLNPKGQALYANLLIKSLNRQFTASIPLLNVNSFRGNIVKNGF